MENTRLQRLLLPVFLLFFFLFFIQKSDLSRADLGRMLKNGEVFFAEKRVLDTNRYSYTEPDRRIPNSHWLTDAFYYRLERHTGFGGLTIAHAAVHTAAMGLFLAYAVRIAGMTNALLLGFLALPLLTSRTWVRPEAFSYFFLGIYLLLLSRRRFVRALPLVQVLWVNMHFWFPLGPLLALFYAVRDRGLRGPAALCLAACFVNPFFLEGVLLPLSLFRPYGYSPGETYPLLDVMRMMPHAIYGHLLVLIAGSAVVALQVARSGKLKDHWPVFAFQFLFAAAAFRAVRAYPLFGYFFVAATAAALGRARWPRAALLIFAVLFAVNGFKTDSLYRPSRPAFGLGLMPGNSGSAEFFKGQRMKGPLFNNFGIGGYLTYHLYPSERVFVDNRPEAYSAEFFQHVYLPMLTDELVWRRESEKYRLEAIWFHRKMHTYSDAAREFLIRRMTDPEWAVVYLDEWTALLARRQGANARTAEAHGVPPERIWIDKI